MKTDVLIIGGGVTGASIAYRLARYNLDIAWVEKENDVCMGSSKANSSMLHDGYNVDKSTLKGKLVLKSHPQYAALAKELHIPYHENAGSIVVGFGEEDMPAVKKQLAMAEDNGIRGMQMLDREELLALEPNLNPEAQFGLYNPNTGIIDSFQLTIALAENAVLNGVKLYTNAEVTAVVAKGGKVQRVETTAGVFEPKVVVNAAGLYADRIAAMVEEIDFSIKPRKGQYFLYDRVWGNHIRHAIYSAPSSTSKGMIMLPTTEGNLIAGSNALPIEDKGDVSTSFAEMEEIYKVLIHKHFPKLPRRGEVITSFTGLRAAANTEDFIIEPAKTVPGFINVAGIQSPGLSSGPGIAEMVEELVRAADGTLDFGARPNHRAGRPVPVALRDMSHEEKAALIAQNPDFGTIVCRCETVSKGEILDALRRPVPAKDLDGVKRRVRAGMGRCQGGFCGPRVLEMLAEVQQVSPLKLTKRGKGSYVLSGVAKDPSLQKGGAPGEKISL